MDQKTKLFNAKLHEIWGKDQKKRSYHKICKKTVLSHEFWGDNQYLGSLRPRTARQWHRASNFLWSTILAWGAQFSFGGAQAVIWGVRPRNAPRGVGPAASLQQFIKL